MRCAAAAGGIQRRLAQVHRAFGVPFADVTGAFQTNNFTQLLYFGLPVNVTLVCSWTWACSSFHNIHANDVGYAVIAATFAETIARSR